MEEVVILEKEYTNRRTYRRFYYGKEKSWRGWSMFHDGCCCHPFNSKIAEKMLSYANFDWRIKGSRSGFFIGQKPDPSSLLETDFPITIEYR